MTSLSTTGRFALSIIFIGTLALFSTGCGHTQVIEIDHRFSYNLCKVPTWFPGEDYTLNAAESEVLQRRGKPEFIRFWWRKDGGLIQSSDLTGKREGLADEMKTAKRTWLYVDENVEIEFKEDGSGYLEHPISQQILLVSQLGDPSTKRPLKKTSSGEWSEKWEWHDQGIWIDFVNGREVDRGYFTRTGIETKP